MIARSKALVAALAVLATVGGCGPQETAPEPAGPAQGVCETPSAMLVDIIESVLADGGKVTGASAVRSADFERAWFVATTVTGLPDPVVHVANTLDGTGQLYAVGGFAHQFSTVGHGEDTRAKFSITSDGFDTAVKCLEAAR